MRTRKSIVSSLVILAAAAGWACSSSVTGTSRGAMNVRLTDAPFPTDSVDSVNVFVTRVDVRAAAADSAAADSATSADSAAAHGWITVASPNMVFNLLTLQNGVSADLGTTSLASGHYGAMRLVIDPSQSSVVLKGGLRLTGTSSPNVTFPSGSRSGIKINVTGGFDIVADDTTGVLLDFNLDQSFVMRGNSITQLGLLFKPVVQASVSN